MSTLDGDDERYLNDLFDGVETRIAEEFKTVHTRINKVEDCSNANKRSIATLMERTKWLAWALTLTLGGILGAAITVLYMTRAL